MNILSRKRVLVGATAVTTLGLVLAPAAAFAAPPAYDPATDADNGSQFPMFLVDADSELEIPETQTLQWNSVVSAVAKTYQDGTPPYDRFPASPDATGVKLFISAVGDEYNQAQWYGTSGGALDANKTNGLSYMPLDYFSDGDRAGDVSDVRTNGGTYSLGFVYTNENGNQITSTGGSWFTIQVTPVTGAWTYDNPDFPPPAVCTISTQPASQEVRKGANATFTAAATNCDSVKWQSSTNGTTWTDISGATTASYTASAVAVADHGKQFRAVFTKGADQFSTSAATLSVDFKPLPGDAGNVVIPTPAPGATTITVPTGQNGQTFAVFAWSEPTQLPNVTTDGSGNAVIDVSSLAPNVEHTISLTNPGDATRTPVAWGTFRLGTPNSVPLEVNVTNTGKFALEGVRTTPIDFGNVLRGAKSERDLGPVKVTDDRTSLLGWALTAVVSDFRSAANDVIPASQLAVTPSKVGAPVPGVTVGTGLNIAEGAVGNSTGIDGTEFDAKLTFTAPRDAAVAAYNSTLTLTLASQ